MQDPRNFQFSSDYPMAYFVYHNTSSIDVPASSGGVVASNTITIPHGLSFIPLLVGYWSDNANFTNTNDLNVEMYGGDYKEVSVTADDTNIYITGRNGRNSGITLYVKLWAYMPPDANGDVQSVFDESNYLFNTDITMLEIAKSGVVKYEDDSKVVYHNLDYVPYCRIWRTGVRDGKKTISPYWITAYGGSLEQGTIDKEKLTLGGVYGDMYYHIYTAEV